MEPSAFEQLLTTNMTFFVRENRRLAARADEIGLPSSEIEDVIAEVWLEAVKHCHLFANGDIEQLLCGWLTQVFHSKAVDNLRHLNRHPCESLAEEEIDLIDDGEAKREKMAEIREWVVVRLASVCRGNEESQHWFSLHFFEGYSIQEIAQQFEITSDTVDCRIRRVVKALRE